MSEHDIIRDLIPSYIDGMTSQASNQLIEEHIKDCSECRHYLEQMRHDLQGEQQVETKKIDAFKKVRQVNRRKIVIAIISVLILCVLAVGGYFYYYGRSWLADFGAVEQGYNKVGDVTELYFKSKEENTYLTIYRKDDDSNVYELREQRINPLDKPLQKTARVGFTFVDEHTILVPNEADKTLSNEDVIYIKFKGETRTYKIQDFYDGENLK